MSCWVNDALKALSRIKSRDLAWYFFSDRGSRYRNTNKQSRTTPSGYWKITGKTAQVKERSSGSHHSIGFKKTLVFLTGKSPHGERTNWIMHEYSNLSSPEEITSHVVCKVEYTGPADSLQIAGESTSERTAESLQIAGESTSERPAKSLQIANEDGYSDSYWEGNTNEDWDTYLV
ncbi:NAC domain-containing protein 68-like [Raphanus sativus]|uniref:NAC domain-containing protein 68-like n=1 Tax=Raphanus sativus TaxID=3726 RepID=A0A6J0M502_RAPSA|nr:NAC domain-containing protein 68-like [Raphanus sativus]